MILIASASCVTNRRHAGASGAPAEQRDSVAQYRPCRATAIGRRRRVNPWFGRTALLFQLVAITIIRAPHGRLVGKLRVVHSRKGRLEVILLALMWIATTILPLI